MLKRRIYSLGLALLVLLGSVSSVAAEQPMVAVMAGELEVNAEAVVVMDADNGRILYAQNPDRRLATGTAIL